MAGQKGEIPGQQGEKPFKKVKPLSPNEAFRRKHNEIPPDVIASFNELIIKNLKDYNNEAIFHQDEILALLKEKGVEEREVFAKKWLDVEPLYEKQGWRVKYEKFDEGGGCFTFSAPGK